MTSRLVRHLVRPARGGAMMLIVVFALLLFICAHAGIFGLPLSVIIVPWFFKYAYILFDAVSRGVDEPPTLDIQMVNPLSEQRPLGQVIIIGAIYGAALLAEMYISRSFAIGILVLSLFLLPASTAVLGVEGHLLKAIYPPAVLRMVGGMGILYGVMLAAIGGYLALAALLVYWQWWGLIELMLGMFAWLSLYSLLGGIVYERRDELGVEVWISPERTAAKRDAERARLDARFLAEVYGKMRAGHHVEAWRMLTAWQAQRGNTLEDFRWLLPRVAQWDDPRYVTRLTQEFLERLLALKQTGEALQVVAARIGEDANFRPKSGSSTLALAQLAARGGGAPRVARRLIADFEVRFPQDSATVAVQSLRQFLHP